jgi:hypothetical protein
MVEFRMTTYQNHSTANESGGFYPISENRTVRQYCDRPGRTIIELIKQAERELLLIQLLE